MRTASQQPSTRPGGQATLEDCLLTLLRGIQNHALTADGSDGQAFRRELGALANQFRGKSNAQQVVDSAVEILDKYGARANQRQKSGLLTAPAELSEAVQTLPAIQRPAERFSRLEEQINAISANDDLNVVKARLREELAAARAESLQEGQAAPGHVAGEIARPADIVHTPDQLTGLPSRASAEVELARAHGHSEDCHLALFILKRLALINAKFGYSCGDQVLRKVVLHLSQMMADFDTLYRWAPCAFLTVAPPNTSCKELRGKVQLIELTRMTPTLEWEGRSAMVPMAIDCRIVSVKDFETPHDLFLRLDTLANDA
jgi:GGDEF domain-containing protein